MSAALPRRTVLRGLGAAVALPLLDAMLPARRALGRGPQRFTRVAWVYVPNGVHMPDWTPAAEGELGELPWILEPLQDLRGDLSVLSGLTHDKARANGDGPGDHARACAVFLTGVQPLKAEGQVRLGASADQVAAEAVGALTRFRSLELGCERGGNSGQCDSGYSCAYSSNLSWKSESLWAGKETNPRLVFDRLFRGGGDAESAAAAAERLRRRRSILDFVRDDAGRLMGRLGAADRGKLDEYFAGVRELERRIEAFAAERVAAVPDQARPAGVPADFAEHVRVMYDLMVLAFQSDVTRVATFLVANEGSNRAYPALGIPEGHHELSHHGRDQAKIDKIRAINRCHVELFAGFLRRLGAARDGDASLLDAAMVVYGSAIADGNAHNHDDLPVLLAGRGHGQLRPGRHLRYPRETPLNNLHLALLQRLGLSQDRLGDSTGVLEGLD